jgi:phosphoketolase
MVMRNDLDRFHLVADVIDRVPGLADAPVERSEVVVRRRSTGH